MCVCLLTDTTLTDAWRRHPLVVVRVDTHTVTLQIKGKLAVFDMFQFVLVKIRPTPQTRVDHMGEPFTACHLLTTTTSSSS